MVVAGCIVLSHSVFRAVGDGSPAAVVGTCHADADRWRGGAEDPVSAGELLDLRCLYADGGRGVRSCCGHGDGCGRQPRHLGVPDAQRTAVRADPVQCGSTSGRDVAIRPRLLLRLRPATAIGATAGARRCRPLAVRVCRALFLAEHVRDRGRHRAASTGQRPPDLADPLSEPVAHVYWRRPRCGICCLRVAVRQLRRGHPRDTAAAGR